MEIFRTSSLERTRLQHHLDVFHSPALRVRMEVTLVLQLEFTERWISLMRRKSCSQVSVGGCAAHEATVSMTSTSTRSMTRTSTTSQTQTATTRTATVTSSSTTSSTTTITVSTTSTSATTRRCTCSMMSHE